MLNKNNVRITAVNKYQSNIQCYIHEVRYDRVVNQLKEDWNSVVWKGFHRFYKFEFNKVARKNIPLDSDFINFAKAYIKDLYSYGRRKEHDWSMSVLKVLEFILLKKTGSAKIFNCSNYIFDECIKFFKAEYSEQTVFSLSKELKTLEVFIRENDFADLGYIEWKNPIKKPQKKEQKNYTVDLFGQDKLPDIESILAIVKIFAKDDNSLCDRDIFTTSIIALLLCAPSRISEILALPADCEVWEKDSEGVERYGIRFFSAKGYEGDIKWISSSMVPVAMKAISRLKSLSSNARKIALHLEKKGNVYRNYLPYDVASDKLLRAEEVCMVLGYQNLSNKMAKKRLCSLKLNDFKLSSIDYTYSLDSLMEILEACKPENFPWYDYAKKIKYSNALCLLNKNQLIEKFPTNSIIVNKPDYNLINNDLRDNSSERNLMRNIFQRHSLTGADNRKLFLKTHQIRHLINTVAQISGMSEADIARWSGRQCIAQNDVYDHTPSANMIKEVVMSQAMNKVQEIIPTKFIANYKFDIEKELNGSILVSKYGYCKHNYAFSPCQYYPVTDSGFEVEGIERIRKMICSISENDFINGNIGAEKWFDFHKKIINNGGCYG
ncbi:DNA-binding protein [Erwinia mallotivora]|uniref:DNA-binding protein n=1 Tax=Erwinia mallotivora TaxID=69222 RepID=UPI0021C0E65B|nr:DNA-binding protein [Erwinia mallotivora]